MPISVVFVDSDGGIRTLDNLIPLDNLRDSVVGMDYQHHQIHDGKAFTSCKLFVHGGGDSPNILLVTPNTKESAHFFYQVISDNVLQVDLYESPDYSGGDALPSYNRNRNSFRTSDMVLTSDAADDGAGKGTLIWSFKAGANKTVTASEGQRFEFILSKNTKYLLETTGINGDLITVLLDWYEHIEHNV